MASRIYVSIVITALIIGAISPIVFLIHSRSELDQTHRNFIESVQALCEPQGVAVIKDSRGYTTEHRIYSCQDFVSLVPEESK